MNDDETYDAIAKSARAHRRDVTPAIREMADLLELKLRTSHRWSAQRQRPSHQQDEPPHSQIAQTLVAAKNNAGGKHPRFAAFSRKHQIAKTT